ncbi:MAG: hypothetical protein WC511_03080 [Candidatus Pacearchaeota archaeon]
MQKVIFIVGLPGSGKTFLGKRLQDAFNSAGIKNLFIDDASTKDQIKIVLGLMKSGETFKDLAFDNTEFLIITDPMLCHKQAQEVAKESFHGVTQTWVYFENNPEQCVKNIHGRDERVISPGWVTHLSQIYHIPEDAFIHKVFCKES